MLGDESANNTRGHLDTRIVGASVCWDKLGPAKKKSALRGHRKAESSEILDATSGDSASRLLGSRSTKLHRLVLDFLAASAKRNSRDDRHNNSALHVFSPVSVGSDD